MGMENPEIRSLTGHCPISPMRLLLVEDSAKLAAWLARSLHHHGYAVDHTGDGAQADALLRTQAYALRGCLLDGCDDEPGRGRDLHPPVAQAPPWHGRVDRHAARTRLCPRGGLRVCGCSCCGGCCCRCWCCWR